MATVDISDHLPVFCICGTAVKHHAHPISFRHYSAFNKELYKIDIRAIHWNTILNLNPLFKHVTPRSTEVLV